MGFFAKQSTAVSYIVGPVLDAAGAEYASAVIGDLSLSKNGGTLTALASAATLTYIANGMYTLALTTGNTDTLGTARVSCNKAGYQMPALELMVQPATVYDALFTNATTATGGLGDIQRMAGTALTARDIGASVLLSSGTGTGQLDLTSGVVKANLTQILGTAPTEGGAGRLAAAFTTLLDVASPVLTAASVNQTGDSYARIGNTGSGLTSLAPAATALSTATWTGTRAGYLDNLSAGAVATAAALATVDDFVDTEVAAIKAVTDKLDTALELDSTVYRFTTNALELAPSGGGSLTAADVWGYATRVLTAGTNIALVKGTGVTGFNDLDAAGVAGAVWDAATASYGSAGSYGLLVETNLDAAVTSRMATYTQPTGFLTATFPSAVASPTNITAGTITTVTNLTNAPTSGDLTAAMKASVNAEVDAAIADARLDELLAADSDIDGAAPPAVGSVFHELMTKTAGSFTYDQATDSLEAVRDRGDTAWVTATGFSTHSAADVWAAGTRTLTGAANITSTGGTITVSAGAVTVGTNNDKTGYTLTQAFPTNFASLSIDGSGLVTLADASLTTAKLGSFQLAKTTNITGFNDIAATAVVSGGAITTSGGAVSTVTSVTNRVTANTDQLAGQTVTAAAGVTFPASVGTSTYAGADTAGTTTLLSLVTATRAGYLDNLSGGAAALEATAQAVKAKTDNLPSDPADQSLLMAAVGAVETDTQDIQSRLPASLVGGRMDASAGALAAGVITDAAFTVPALTGPASGVVGYIAMLHRRFFGKSTRDATTIKTYADNGTTVLTTQTYTAVDVNETVNAAT